MPFSSENGKPQIRKIIERLKPSTMLDVGCGSGTYAKMFPNIQKTGIEIWQPYIEQYGLKDLYSDVKQEDVRTWAPDTTYDVAILGDVLEHMTIDEAKAVFDKIRNCATSVIVSIPIGHYPQGEYEGNPYEAHVVDHWTDDMVRETFGEPTWGQVDGEIGVYVWSPVNVRPKICVYAISKNEAHFIPRFCESAKGADLILIADTGSDDGLPEEAEKHGAQVHHISITPWRYQPHDYASIAAWHLGLNDISIEQAKLALSHEPDNIRLSENLYFVLKKKAA